MNNISARLLAISTQLKVSDRKQCATMGEQISGHTPKEIIDSANSQRWPYNASGPIPLSRGIISAWQLGNAHTDAHASGF